MSKEQGDGGAALVERLRAMDRATNAVQSSDHFAGFGYCTVGPTCVWHALPTLNSVGLLCEDAADKIERLEAALESLLAHACEHPSELDGEGRAAVSEARAVLAARQEEPS